jgi:hypothetical protein
MLMKVLSATANGNIAELDEHEQDVATWPQARRFTDADNFDVDLRGV